MAFFKELLMFFSSVVFSLYRGHCSDGVVVSFNFLIDSLWRLVLLSLLFLFSSLYLSKSVFCVLPCGCIFYYSN